MEKKEIPTNVNNHTNQVNVNVNIPPRKRNPNKKKASPNWYVKTILGGSIALILSIGGYYIKKNMDQKSKGNNTAIDPNGQPIEGTKQN